MARFFYLSIFLISVIIFLVYLLFTKNKKADIKQVLLFLCIMVSNAGYSMGIFADTLDVLLIANMISYMSLYSCVFVILIEAQMCDIKLSKWLIYALFLVATIIIMFVFTSEIQHLYYKSYSKKVVDGVSYLVKEYGPVHYLFYTFIGIGFLLIIGMVVTAIVKKKTVSIETIILLLLIWFFNTLTYAWPRIFNLDIDLLPLSYDISGLIFIYLFYKARLYDISSNITNAYEKNHAFGYVTLNSNNKFLGSTGLANIIYPNLTTIRIDSFLSEKNSGIEKGFFNWIEKWQRQEILSDEKYIINTVYNDKELIISCNINYLTFKKKKIGFLIEFQDDTKQQQYINWVKNYSQKLEQEVGIKTMKIQAIQDSIIAAMATMVESRDNSTGGHITRTSRGVRVFALELSKDHKYKNMSTKFYKDLIKAAPMHDLGKIAVDDVVLRKPGKFTPEEYEIMKKHPAEGYKIVHKILMAVEDEEFKEIAENVAHYHHERWDGAGYPEGLRGETIPIEARIMAFADVFDALVSKRCYKEAFSFDEAFKIIEDSLGTQFDPDLGRVFLNIRERLEDEYRKLLKL